MTPTLARGLARDRLWYPESRSVPVKACLTYLAAVGWIVSATLWWWASRRAPSLPPLTADADVGWETPFNEALTRASQRNAYAALAAMVAALLQAAALLVH